MMQLLSGHSLTVSSVFQPETMSIQLTERTSTATMTLDDNAPTLAVGDWLRADSGPGSGIVWRVRTIDTQYEKHTRTVTLEHAIATLKDKILFGEKTPEDMGGGTTATAEQAVSYILGHQSDWVIGTMERTATKPYTFNGDTLFNALEIVSSTLTECVWEYSFSSYPFTLNMRAIDNNTVSEMRMDRNIRTLKKSIDRSRMYTRFYPIGKNDLHLSSQYVSQNENLYGVISKTETDQSKETEDELYDWAVQRLDRHCNPIVTVTISGEDLSEATGEPLDSFTIGKYCRIPLPEFNTTINERVSKLNYTDVIHDPETVTVTLANEVPDVATVYKQEVSEKVAKSSRIGAKNGKDDHAWMVDTDTHIGLVAEAVAGEGADHDWSRVAQVMVDGQGVHQRVTYTEDQIVQAWSAIEMTESQITLEVANAVSGLHSVIEQTSDRILEEVGRKNSVFESWENPSQSQDVSTGDFWIKSNGIRTYGKAGEYTWDTLGGYAWADFYGSEIYVLNESGEWELVGGDQLAEITRTRIDRTDEQIALITDSMSGDYAEFIVELGRIHSRVTSVEDGLSSTIEQTASMIRSAVWTANSDMYSEILQTQSMIRSEVANTQSDLRSTITQTASGIWSEVGRKATIYTQWSDPSNNNTIHTGDMWIRANNIRTYEAMQTKTWNALSGYTWSDFYGSLHYIWENGAWKRIASEQLENINHEFTEETETRFRRVLEDMAGNYSEFLQEKDRIRSTVRNVRDDLGSSILQTASMIRSDVWAAESTFYSTISQTATEIRSEVGNTVSAIRSSITQNANKIALVVESTAQGNAIKPASIVAAINDGASSIVISASHIDLDGYVKATDITTTLISTKLASATNVNVKRLTLTDNGYISLPNGQDGNVTITGAKAYDTIKGLKVVSSGNNYKLQATTYGDASWHDLPNSTFSRAVSSWSVGGGDGKVNVTANPQNQTKGVKVSISGSNSVTSNGSQTYTVMYENADGDDVSTGATLDVSISVSATAPEGKSLASDITGSVQVRSTVSGGSAGSYKSFGMYSDTYTPQGVGSSHDCIVVKDGTTIIGRYDIQTSLNSKYNLGWNDCRAQFLTSATTLWSVKTRTMTIDDVGREFYIRDTSYTAYTNDPGTK